VEKSREKEMVCADQWVLSYNEIGVTSSDVLLYSRVTKHIKHVVFTSES
jgi:hypothetical protein